jgi:hypothetical protein
MQLYGRGQSSGTWPHCSSAAAARPVTNARLFTALSQQAAVLARAAASEAAAAAAEASEALNVDGGDGEGELDTPARMGAPLGVTRTPRQGRALPASGAWLGWVGTVAALLTTQGAIEGPWFAVPRDTLASFPLKPPVGWPRTRPWRCGQQGDCPPTRALTGSTSRRRTYT